MTNPNHKVSDLTKREYFAAMAMQGLLDSRDGSNFMNLQLAEIAVKYADTLIKALNEKENDTTTDTH